MSSIIEQPRYSCALSAQQTVLAIPKAHPIIHAGPGCSERAHLYSAVNGGYQGEGYTGGPHISSTNSTQKEIIFGGEKKLRDTISGALEVIDSNLYVVMTGCTADIVGDDTVSVAKEFAEEGHPVVGVETAGFKGTVYYGYHQILKAIIEQYVGDAEPAVRKGLVNVFAGVPYQNPFWKGDLQEIREQLERLGLEVHVLFGEQSEGVSEWKDIPNAELNLLLSPWVGTETVKLLERKYGTPYLQFPGVPVGAKQTGELLKRIGEKLDLQGVEEEIERQERIYYGYFNAVADFLADYREEMAYKFYAVADSNYGVSVSRFLREELGMLPQGIFLTDEPKDKYRDAILDGLREKDESLADWIVFENDGGKIQKQIRETLDADASRTLILGSTWDKFLAEELESQYIPLSVPLPQLVVYNTSYAGYRGGITLLKEICNGIF